LSAGKFSLKCKQFFLLTKSLRFRSSKRVVFLGLSSVTTVFGSTCVMCLVTYPAKARLMLSVNLQPKLPMVFLLLIKGLRFRTKTKTLGLRFRTTKTKTFR